MDGEGGGGWGRGGRGVRGVRGDLKMIKKIIIISRLIKCECTCNSRHRYLDSSG